MMSRYRVLIVCTGNTCRSPMAEGALRVLVDGAKIDFMEILSAGTHSLPSCPPTLHAIEACKTWHADISHHRSRRISCELLEECDLILCMTAIHYREVVTICPEVRDLTFMLKKYPDPGDEGEGVADPIGGSLDQYNTTFLEIGEELGRILPDIIAQARKKME